MNQHDHLDPEDHPELDQTDFERMTASGISRRNFMRGSAAAMGLFLATSPLAQAVAAVTRPSTGKLLGFRPVAASTADTFEVPEGYVARPLISWGDPILKGAPAFDESGTQTAAAQAGQFGDNTDGMSLFPLAEDRALLAVNNEYTNYEYLFAHQGKQSLTADEVKKAQAAHGVSIFEIRRNRQGEWQVNPEAELNRRITGYTPMEVTGPVAGHPLMQTAADPDGRRVLGTLNNCANEPPGGPISPVKRTSISTLLLIRMKLSCIRITSVMGSSLATRIISGMRRTSALIWPNTRTSPTGLAGWWRSTPEIRPQRPKNVPHWVASSMRMRH